MYQTTMNLLTTISDNGYKAYVVGGYARDMYLNRETLDVDICTNATPKQLKDIFGDALMPNIQYGSMRVIINKVNFEITTFRKEIKYENNRLPIKIKYIDSLLEDLKRRDFTMNTLCLDKDGQYIDLLDAYTDLDNKIIRTVGNPKKKIKEDSLRILRAIRFATVLDFSLEENLKKAIKKYGYMTKKLSYYRKKEELEKIFTSPNAAKGISLLRELGLVSYLELNNFDKLVLTTSLIGIWVQLNVDDKYLFSSSERKTMKQVRELLEKGINCYTLYYYGLYSASIAGEILELSQKDITKEYNDLPIHSSKDIMITVGEICDLLKKTPGSFIKDIIKDLEAKIIDKTLNNNKEEIKEYLIANY